MPRILPYRSPLAYPAGVAPGFDPSHLALAGATACRFSGVMLPSGFLNLLRPQVPTINGTPTNVMTAYGPALNIPAVASTNYQFATPAVQDAYRTFGAIVVHVTNGAPNVLYTDSTTSTSGQAGFGLGSGANSHKLYATLNGGNQVNSNLVLSVSVPYFVAVSIDWSAALASVVFVAMNLTTGQMQTAGPGTLTQTQGATDGTCRVGGTSSGNQQILALAAHNGLMSISELMAWAADPWSFWYPRRISYSVAAAAVASGWGQLLSGRRSSRVYGAGV